MNTTIFAILALVLFVGALLAAWGGIRSIQSARTVIFYRTRQARMMAGWQLLAVSTVLVFFALGSLFFGKPVVTRLLSPAPLATASPAWTPTPLPTSSQMFLTTPSVSAAPSTTTQGTSTVVSTPTAPATSSRTPSYLGTYTAMAVWTERRSTFIAMLSFTPTASRTPIPTWTRTPSPTPRPTYTASPTRTPRPTITHLPTHTPIPTWTSSPTRTPVTPSPTRTASPTRTPSLTPTPSPTRTTTPTRTATP